MITGSPTPISGLPTGTIDDMDAVFPMNIGMPEYPQTIQASLLQIAQFLQSQGQMVSGSYALLDGRYQPTGTSGGADNGWISDGNTWVYASADDPSYVVSVNANVTGTMGLGTKVKFTQHSADKHGIVTQATLSGSYTYLNLYCGTDYDVSSSGTITNPYYSYQKAPYGFPLSPAKWTLEVTDTSTRTKTSPSGTMWYGETNAIDSGSLPDIDIPIGAWIVTYKAIGRIQTSTSTFARIDLTLSTSGSNESDADLTTAFSFNAGFDGTGVLVNLPLMLSYPKVLILTAKTRYYLLMRTTSIAASIQVQGASSTTILRAVCAYL